MRRYIVLLFALVNGLVALRAQFDAQMGQYMFMQSAYNPAAVGDGDFRNIL